MQTLRENTTLQSGKYRIIKVLGQGGFGITYLAEQVMLGREVAIKEFFYRDYCDREEGTSHVTLGTQSNRETVQRFMNKFLKEARTISQLDHPNIIKIHDIFEENNTAYYVMEYIEGENLSEMVKRHGALPEATAVAYIRKVADALAYIHARSINHLDVKPGNIMLRQHDQQIVLIDFGLSKQYDEVGSQTSSTPVGVSQGYAPVEQYSPGGVPTFSPSTDIYSMGATLYWLIIGKTPPNANEVLNMGLPPMPSYVSASVKKAIESAMQAKKVDRPQSVEAFLNLFDKGKSTSTPPPSPKNVGQNDEETRVLQKESQQPATLNGYHKKKFDDGSVYEGNFVNGRPEGKGTMKYVGGASYIGEWHYGLREGEGTWNYPDGGSYIGSWVRGRRHGRGTLKKKDGTVIVGEWKDDRLVSEILIKEPIKKEKESSPSSDSGTAKGILTILVFFIPLVIIMCFKNCNNSSNDYVYKCDTIIADTESIKSGYVENYCISYDTGGVYYWTGYLKDFWPEGKGVAIYSSDDPYGRKQYKGEFSSAKGRHGVATLTYRNGDKYDGTFSYNHFDSGTFTIAASGEKYIGTFKNDQPYNGQWYNNKGKVRQKVVNGK